MKKMFSGLVKDVLDFIYPGICIISGERLNENNSNQYACDDEISSIPRVTTSDLADLRNKINSDHSFALFAFREGDDFSKIIYSLKYGGMNRLGIYLGELLGEELRIYLDKRNLTCPSYIIPVPLFRTKQRERGYNQSDSICTGINKILEKEFVAHLVKRIRHTNTQTMLSREERIVNLKDAFEINSEFKNEIQGKDLLLVDDVVTTGSTMNEVIKVLRENKCGEITACCLAMAR